MAAKRSHGAFTPEDDRDEGAIRATILPRRVMDTASPDSSTRRTISKQRRFNSVIEMSIFLKCDWQYAQTQAVWRTYLRQRRLKTHRPFQSGEVPVERAEWQVPGLSGYFEHEAV